MIIIPAKKHLHFQFSWMQLHALKTGATQEHLLGKPSSTISVKFLSYFFLRCTFHRDMDIAKPVKLHKNACKFFTFGSYFDKAMNII